ncbi:MAG: hypothetical protein ABEJ89_04710 [Haloarculaceae archaeon]
MSDGGGARTRTARLREHAVRVAFGDRIGLALFLASLVAFVALWRIAFLINDSYTLANGVVALSHGRLSMDHATYGSLHSPGTTVVGNAAYARNYGVLVAALPVLAGIRAVGAVADLRVALVGGWSLLVLGTFVLAGRILDRERSLTLAGSAIALLLFAGNVALATPFPTGMDPLVALQVVHMTAAAFVTVFAYRLVAALGTRRQGVLAAALVVLGTPLAFWASVPKRHVITAAVVLVVAYALARSRDADRVRSRRLRAATYGLVTLYAWVHAPEALIVFVALALVDLPTAPANDRRTLATIAGAVALAALPFLVTNVLISGDPFRPPRMFAGGSAASGDTSLGGAGAGGGGAAGGIVDGVPLLGPLVGLLSASIREITQPFAALWGLLLAGVDVFVSRPDRVVNTFVRSGYIARVADGAKRASTDLAVLESAPLLAGALAVLPVSVGTARGWIDSRSASLPTATDAFLLTFGALLTTVYVGRLPIHAQVTVRYLFPVYPIGVVLLVRLAPVRTALTTHWRALAYTYAAAVLIGGQLLLVALVVLAPGLSEAFQLHALLGLGTAVALGAWAVTGATDGRGGRAGAVGVGLAAATTTLFLVFAALEYYPLGGSHALPVMRALSELLRVT